MYQTLINQLAELSVCKRKLCFFIAIIIVSLLNLFILYPPLKTYSQHKKQMTALENILASKTPKIAPKDPTFITQLLKLAHKNQLQINTIKKAPPNQLTLQFSGQFPPLLNLLQTLQSFQTPVELIQLTLMLPTTMPHHLQLQLTFGGVVE